MLGKKINPRQTKALDNHPALKGKQSRLPDELQAKIIGSKLRKTASHVKLASNLEGRMARRQLTEVCEMAQELLMYMGDDEDLHEWVQNKITTIHDRLSSVHSYVSYEKKNPPMLEPQVLGAGV
jgi:hypothetical protein